MKFFFEFTYILGYLTIFFGIIIGYHLDDGLPYGIMLVMIGWITAHQARKILGHYA